MGKKRSNITPLPKIFNILAVKNLRPKVYIIHSSSFKSLVQEVTGKNGRRVQSQLNQEKVINIEDDQNVEESYQEASIILGSSSSSSSSPSSLNSSKEDSTQLLPYDLRMCFEDTTSYDQSLSLSSPSMEVGALDCQFLDVDALLLDVDLEENPFFSGYYQYHQEFPGLI